MDDDSDMSRADYRIMRVLAVVFVLVGVALALATGNWVTGLPFVVMGLSFAIIGWIRD